MKLVLALIALAVAGVAFAAAANRKAPARILPYVVPSSYFEADASRTVARSLGHGLSVTLVF